MQLVNRLSGGGYGSITAKGTLCGQEVVVDGFGNTYNRHAFLCKTMRNLKATVTTHGNMAEKTHTGKILNHSVGNIADLKLTGQVLNRHGKGVAFVGRAKDGAAG